MTARRNALGRGLGALIPSAPKPSGRIAPTTGEDAPDADRGAADAAQVAPPGAPAATGIEVRLIDPNPEQPRRVFEPEQLERLVESVRRHGILQPVVVRRAGERFELVVGERRWRAAQAAGLDRIPAVVSDIDTQDRLEVAIVENVQRHDLNPIELAHAFRALAESGYTQEEIGQRVGIDRSSVANHQRLLELTRELQGDVESGVLTMGHAKALLQVSNPERRLHLRNEIVEGGLSVRESERRGRAVAGPAPPRKRKAAAKPGSAASDPALAGLVETLKKHLQTQVRIQGSPQRGRIEIEYFGDEDLQRISDVLLGDFDGGL